MEGARSATTRFLVFGGTSTKSIDLRVPGNWGQSIIQISKTQWNTYCSNLPFFLVRSFVLYQLCVPLRASAQLLLIVIELFTLFCLQKKKLRQQRWANKTEYLFFSTHTRIDLKMNFLPPPTTPHPPRFKKKKKKYLTSILWIGVLLLFSLPVIRGSSICCYLFSYESHVCGVLASSANRRRRQRGCIQ